MSPLPARGGPGVGGGQAIRTMLRPIHPYRVPRPTPNPSLSGRGMQIALDTTNHIGYQPSRPLNPKRKGKKGGNPDRGVRANVRAAGAESSGSKPKLR